MSDGKQKGVKDKRRRIIAMMWIPTCKHVYQKHYPVVYHLFRPENGDPEDLWDFGTVRHGGRNTVGRSQNSMRVSGPPLTWENNASPHRPNEHSPSSPHRVSISSNNSSITTKGELPPLPPSASSQKTHFQQSTVRHMPPETIEKPQSSPTAVVSQPQTPQVEDYDDQYVVDTFSSAKSGILHKIQDMQLDDDDFPDTTMLDSVILPAIASVGSLFQIGLYLYKYRFSSSFHEFHLKRLA